jgi:hypothetical protein
MNTNVFLMAAGLIGLIATCVASEKEKDKSITCNEKRPQVVRVALGRVTVLNFPFRPKEVVPGNQAFDFKQIKNDLVIMSSKPNGHTNAVVYLDERRCNFDLISVRERGDDVLIVKDPKDSQFEVKF